MLLLFKHTFSMDFFLYLFFYIFLIFQYSENVVKFPVIVLVLRHDLFYWFIKIYIKFKSFAVVVDVDVKFVVAPIFSCCFWPATIFCIYFFFNSTFFRSTMGACLLLWYFSVTKMKQKINQNHKQNWQQQNFRKIKLFGRNISATHKSGQVPNTNWHEFQISFNFRVKV